MQVSLRERHKEILTGVSILSLFVMVFLGAELVLRVQQILTFGTAKSVEESDKFYIDEDTGLRLAVPGSVHGKIKINNHGFRGPNVETPKPDNVVRLAFLGSSIVFDPYILDHRKTWTHTVVEHLNSSFPGCRFDYVNAGMPGFSSARLIELYENFVKQLEPDIVFIMSADMNVDLNQVAKERGVRESSGYRPSWLADKSLFWSKVEKNAYLVKGQRSVHILQGKLDFEIDTVTQSFSKRLTTLVSDIKSSGGVPVLLSVNGQLRSEQDPGTQVAAASTDILYMPYMSIDGFNKARDGYNLAVERVARDEGAMFIDWGSKVPGDASYYADSRHFSAAGGQLAGQEIGNSLTRSAVFKSYVNRVGVQCANASAH